MYLGRVVGTLVSTRKEPSLDGLRFLVVRRLTIDNKDTETYVVAADAVDAGMGEIVLYATGSSARQTKLTHERPNDATIMAIVDTWEVDGDVMYTKQEALDVDLIEGESVSEDGVSEDGV